MGDSTLAAFSISLGAAGILAVVNSTLFTQALYYPAAPAPPTGVEQYAFLGALYLGHGLSLFSLLRRVRLSHLLCLCLMMVYCLELLRLYNTKHFGGVPELPEKMILTALFGALMNLFGLFRVLPPNRVIGLTAMGNMVAGVGYILRPDFPAVMVFGSARAVPADAGPWLFCGTLAVLLVTHAIFALVCIGKVPGVDGKGTILYQCAAGCLTVVLALLAAAAIHGLALPMGLLVAYSAFAALFVFSYRRLPLPAPDAEKKKQ